MFGALVLAALLACSGSPGVLETHVTRGDTVAVCFEFPLGDQSWVDYFRVRRSQTAAGSFDPFLKVPAADRGFTFSPDRTSNLCVSTVWSELVNGVKVSHETPCSNHVIVYVDNP